MKEKAKVLKDQLAKKDKPCKDCAEKEQAGKLDFIKNILAKLSLMPHMTSCDHITPEMPPALGNGGGGGGVIIIKATPINNPEPKKAEKKEESSEFYRKCLKTLVKEGEDCVCSTPEGSKELLLDKKKDNISNTLERLKTKKK